VSYLATWTPGVGAGPWPEGRRPAGRAERRSALTSGAASSRQPLCESAAQARDLPDL